jgi:hypothetical protein
LTGIQPIWDTNLTASHWNRIHYFASALFILGIVTLIAWPFVGFQRRLSKNGAIANQLVSSLEVQFPGVPFRGVASYELDVIYISFLQKVDRETRSGVENWLRKQKSERRIAAEIWLRLAGDFEDGETIKISAWRSFRGREC